MTAASSQAAVEVWHVCGDCLRELLERGARDVSRAHPIQLGQR